MVALLQTLATSEEGQPVLYILEMQVAGSQRSAGIGRRLMAEAEAEARQRGISTLMLTVLEGNVGAMRFYDREGFVILAEQCSPGEFYVMVRSLE